MGKLIKTTKEIIDKIGWKIPKGAQILILKEIKNPVTKMPELMIAIDNGTGVKNTFPKTLINKKDLKWWKQRDF